MKKLIATFVIGLFLAFSVIGVAAETPVVKEHSFSKASKNTVQKKHRHWHRRWRKHHRRHHKM